MRWKSTDAAGQLGSFQKAMRCAGSCELKLSWLSWRVGDHAGKISSGRRLCYRAITGRGQGRKVFDGLLTTSHNISHIRHSWQEPCLLSDGNHLTIYPFLHSCLRLYCVSLSSLRMYSSNGGFHVHKEHTKMSDTSFPACPF